MFKASEQPAFADDLHFYHKYGVKSFMEHKWQSVDTLQKHKWNGVWHAGEGVEI